MKNNNMFTPLHAELTFVPVAARGIFRRRIIFAHAALAVAAAVSFATPAIALHRICLKTVATYNGNLGGYAGADAKCDLEFPGFKFPGNYTTAIDAIPYGQQYSYSDPLLPYPVIYHETNIYNGNSNPWAGWTGNSLWCSNYTSSSPSEAGGIINLENRQIAGVYCSDIRPLVCCNFK